MRNKRLIKPAQGDSPDYFQGRGAQINTRNRFLQQSYVQEHAEGIDEWGQPDEATIYLEENAKTLVNKVDSPDVGMWYSMNPYQGCEHGCIYCYARNAHEYWGYSAGSDFEHKILVKKNAAQLLRKFLDRKDWEVVPISLSGNTDCYQPAERKFRITRSLLEVALEYRQPIGILTKNAGVLRDADLLREMSSMRLVTVLVSLTTFNEDLRRAMEPRTTTAHQRLKVLETLSSWGIPTGVMTAPMIPGLNDHEMPALLKAAKEAGASRAGYTVVRLNGAIKLLFHDWLYKNFPDRADKVWHQIEACHGGKVNDSEFGRRMSGEGGEADVIRQQFRIHTQRLGLNSERLSLDTSLFRRPGEQMRLF
ncbi:PA0069 family radical SAM protein [Dinghuibacter silviterrae]|uniref:DNA repair photolyase n=1 Tax=Dinghuibacter silviterrae TaxID=1539049 RepID=A0A4R8DPF6_9BACT|nr:PA0069 family radical SAM protein [Dinghuibacter silviterrae]TDW99999.1 DNA repair photolyase [Dinghuibacter silviterrae]